MAPSRYDWKIVDWDIKPQHNQPTNVNPYKPSVSFFGQRQTVQTQIRRPRARRLIRVFTVCWQEFLSKIEQKWKSTPDTLKIRNGLIQLIRMEKPTRQIWVKNVTSCSSLSTQTYGGEPQGRTGRPSVRIMRAATWQNQQNECAPSEDSDQPGHQNLRCPHEESLGPKLPIGRTAKTLIRLGRCPGWSESSLGAHSFCWFCHVTAHVTWCGIMSSAWSMVHLLQWGSTIKVSI